MPARNRCFLLRTSLLRTSQVLVLGVCSAGFSARYIAAQIVSAPGAQTPSAADARQPSAAANQTPNQTLNQSEASASTAMSRHLLANSSVKLGPGDLVEITVFGVP